MQHALVENNFNKLSSIYYRRYVVRIYIVDNSIFVIINKLNIFLDTKIIVTSKMPNVSHILINLNFMYTD